MLLLLLLLFLPSISSSNFPVVQTSYGSVRGYEFQADSGFVAEIFKKIPFASPPIGPRRWKKPVPPQPWNQTLDGTFFGPACAQHPAFWKGYVTGFSEDCLTLNVFTSRKCRESNASCPVVIYLHGGNALYEGTMKFPDETLVRNFASQGIIMVTTAYRLGVFGVMALGDENVLPANLAIHDVLEGLRFVRREIHNFGGDKDQITVMGHSTGATIVTILAFSPGISKPDEPPLFSRAIAMSTSSVLLTEEHQVEKSHGVAKTLGCTGTAQEVVDCLMPFSTDELINAAFELSPTKMKAQLMDITVAGELFPIRNVKEMRENPKPTKLMIGTTLLEMGYFFDSNITDILEFDRKATPEGTTHVNVILGVENVEECTEKYFRDRESGAFETGYTMMSQGTLMTAWLYANAQARAGGEVYLYSYDYPAHAIHTDDAYYVLGFHEHPVDENEKWLSQVYPVYFSNFIKGLPLAPDWKPTDADLMNYYSVNKSFTDGIVPRMKLGFHKDLADYYEGIVKFDENLSKIKQLVLNQPVEYKNLPINSLIIDTGKESIQKVNAPVELKQLWITNSVFNFTHLVIASITIAIILLALVKLYHFCPDHHDGLDDKSPILKYS